MNNNENNGKYDEIIRFINARLLGEGPRKQRKPVKNMESYKKSYEEVKLTNSGKLWKGSESRTYL